ncbi:unnamed protein product, partial [Linum tenue]
ALNSDGSIYPDSGHATASGLIRDHTGSCLAPFTINLEICSITRPELRGDLEGLQLAWELGLSQGPGSARLSVRY